MRETVSGTEDEGYVIGSEYVTFGAGAGPELAGRTQERWWIRDPDGRKRVSGIRTKADAEDERRRLIADTRTVPVELVNGDLVAVPAGIARDFVGLDEDGDWVCKEDFPDGSTMLYALTPCCHASGKGSVNCETGVVCRACYDEVDPKYGDLVNLVAVPAKP